jgi:hypothetical protein
MPEYGKQWNMQFEKLVEFKRTNGDCMVPQNYEQDKSLGNWVSMQRKHHNTNKLRQDRKRILDEIGFAWKDDGASNDKLWHQQYEKLVEFKRKNGHCRVPTRYKDDKSLGTWVETQRKCHKNNKLRLDRKIILDEVGFAWKPDGDHNFKQDDKLWHQQYEKVIEFKRTNGHCMVPFKYEQDKFLGKWVSHQRSIHKNNKIRPDRKDVLDKIGFVWKHVTLAARASTTWQKHYEKLVEFKQKKGHCMVPKRYEADKSLGRWVGTQRTDHKNNKMRPDRKRILDEIGFAWNQAITDPARSSTTNVRNLGIGSFHALGSRSCFSLSFFFSVYLCAANGFGSQPIRRTRREYGASARAR